MEILPKIHNNLIRPGTESIWEILESICDPEIPVLSITDLGIVRDVVLKACSCEIVLPFTVWIHPLQPLHVS